MLSPKLVLLDRPQRNLVEPDPRCLGFVHFDSNAKKHYKSPLDLQVWFHFFCLVLPACSVQARSRFFFEKAPHAAEKKAPDVGGCGAQRSRFALRVPSCQVLLLEVGLSREKKGRRSWEGLVC